MPYPWYEIVNERGVLQGDILERFEVIFPIESTVNKENVINSKAEVYDVVVLSQSCDLEENKIKSVLLCPFFEISIFRDHAPSFFKGKEGLEQIRRGLIPGLHMLKDCDIEGFIRPVRIVDFHVVFTMPIEYVRDFAERMGKRIRLCPPYIEHLSQSFARYFMRVGLPTDIPKFK